MPLAERTINGVPPSVIAELVQIVELEASAALASNDPQRGGELAIRAVLAAWDAQLPVSPALESWLYANQGHPLALRVQVARLLSEAPSDRLAEVERGLLRAAPEERDELAVWIAEAWQLGRDTPPPAWLMELVLAAKGEHARPLAALTGVGPRRIAELAAAEVGAKGDPDRRAEAASRLLDAGAPPEEAAVLCARPAAADASVKLRCVDLAIEARLRGAGDADLAQLWLERAGLVGEMSNGGLDAAVSRALAIDSRLARAALDREAPNLHLELAALAESPAVRDPHFGPLYFRMRSLAEALAGGDAKAVVAKRRQLAGESPCPVVAACHAARAALSLEVQEPAAGELLLELAQLAQERLAERSVAEIRDRAWLRSRPDPAAAVAHLAARGPTERRWAAQLAEHRLRDPRQAIEAWRAVAERVASSWSYVFDHLATCQRRAGDLAATLASYRLLAEREATTSAAAVWSCAGGVLALRRDAAAARPLLERAAAACEVDSLSRLALAALYRALGEWEAAEASLREVSTRLRTPAARRRAGRMLAEVLDQGLQRGAEAELALEEIVAEDPLDAEALVALGDLYARRDKPMLALAAKRRAADLLVAKDAKLRQLLEVAQLCLRHRQLEDARAALEQAELLDAEHGGVQRLFAELYEQLGERERAVVALRAELARQPAPARRQEVQLRLAALLTRLELEPEAIVAAYLDVLGDDPAHAEALAGIQAPARALGWWDALARAFRAAPATPEHLAVLTEALEKMERWAELARVHESLLVTAEPEPERARRAVALAELYEERLGDVDAAIERLELAASLQTTDEGLAVERDRLDALLQRHARWAALIERLGARLSDGALDAAGRAAVLLRRARLQCDELGDLGAAVGSCEEALRAVPEDAAATELLEELHQRLGNHEELAEMLRGRADQLDSGQRAAVLARLANLHVTRGELDAAFGVFRAALEDRPADREIFTSFERLCYREGRWRDALELYDVAIRHVEAGARRAYRLSDLYARKAQVLWRYLRDHEGAIASLSKLISLDGDPDIGAKALEEICAARQDYRPLVAAFEQRAASTQDPARRAAALRHAAAIAAAHLDAPDTVASLHEQLLAVAPGDAGATAALEVHYRERGDIPALLALLRGQLAAHPEGPARVALLQRIAEVSEEDARDVDGAIAHYRLILEHEPNHLESLEALGRIYEATERWLELLEVTQRQIKGTSDRASKALLYFRCGSVMEAKFAREDDAIRYYEAAIRVSSACMPAIHGLRDLYRRRPDWEKVIETLHLEYKLWHDDKERAGVLAQIGQIYATRIGDHARGLRCFEEALSIDPECVPASSALFEHHYAIGGWERALALANTIAHRTMRDGDPVTRSEFFRKRGEVALHTGDPRAAADCLVAALEIRPTNQDALDALGALARAHHDAYDFDSTYHELERIYRRREDATPLVARVWVAQALLAERSGDLEAAEERAAAALELAPGDFTVVSGVIDLHCDMRRWATAIQVIETFLAGGADGAERTRALLRQAEIHADGEVDTLRAITVLREVLRVDPGCHEAYYLLAQQYYLHGRFAEARTAMDRAIELADGQEPRALPGVRARYAYYLGRIFEAAGDLVAAAGGYRRAMEHDPAYPPPVLLLARQASEAGDQRHAEALLLEAARAAIAQGGPAAAVPLQRGLARNLLATGDRAAAIEAYRGMLAVTPDNASDRVALAEIYAVDDLPRAISELRKVLDRDIHHAPAYRALASYYSRTGETERASRVLAALDLLGFAEDSDRSTAQRMRVVRLEIPLLRSLDPDHRHHLLATSAMRDVLGELWTALAAEITAQFPSPPLGENLAELDEERDAGLVADYRSVSRIFETSAEVLLADNVPGMAAVTAFPKATIVLDRRLASEGSPARRFLLGWALDAIRGGYALLLSMGAAHRQGLSTLLRSLVASEGSRSGAAAKLVKAAAPHGAKVLERYAGRVRDLDVHGWIDGMQAGAKRAGLLVCDDFAAAIWMIARLSGESLGSHHAMVALGAVLGGPDLVRYYLSDDYQRLRDILTMPSVSG
ncbi:MAG: hypothetical protein R3B48_09980 [Kofleriaceae bacterium]